MKGAASLSADAFVRTVKLAAGLDRLEPDERRRTTQHAAIEAIAERLVDGGDAGALMAALPRVLGDAMQAFGWSWNGFYVAHPDGRLRLGHAYGPPVCAELERHGGLLSSGMCFDAYLLNQCLVVPDVKVWPGYVSCDAESGLNTVGGIVCPVRDPDGRPLGVWDLDATQPVTAGDGRLVESLFAGLARVFALRAVDLGPG